MTTAPLSFADAAKALGMSRSAFYAWAATDDFPLPVVMIGSRRRIPAPAVEFFAIHGRAATRDELAAFVRGAA